MNKTKYRDEWTTGYVWGLRGERIPSSADPGKEPSNAWIDGWEAGHDKCVGAEKAAASEADAQPDGADDPGYGLPRGC